MRHAAKGCRVFEKQAQLMEKGLDAEKAYRMALAEHEAVRKQQELAERVAQEQLLESNAMPPSEIIERLMREERDVS